MRNRLFGIIAVSSILLMGCQAARYSPYVPITKRQKIDTESFPELIVGVRRTDFDKLASLKEFRPSPAVSEQEMENIMPPDTVRRLNEMGEWSIMFLEPEEYKKEMENSIAQNLIWDLEKTGLFKEVAFEESLNNPPDILIRPIKRPHSIGASDEMWYFTFLTLGIIPDYQRFHWGTYFERVDAKSPKFKFHYTHEYILGWVAIPLQLMFKSWKSYKAHEKAKKKQWGRLSPEEKQCWKGIDNESYFLTRYILEHRDDIFYK